MDGVLPKASDLPNSQLTLIAFVVALVFLTFWVLSKGFSRHLTKLMDSSAAESEKDRQLHRDVTQGVIHGLQGVQSSVVGLTTVVHKQTRQIDRLSVAVTGGFIDDDSNPEPK